MDCVTSSAVAAFRSGTVLGCVGILSAAALLSSVTLVVLLRALYGFHLFERGRQDLDAQNAIDTYICMVITPL